MVQALINIGGQEGLCDEERPQSCGVMLMHVPYHKKYTTQNLP